MFVPRTLLNKIVIFAPCNKNKWNYETIFQKHFTAGGFFISRLSNQPNFHRLFAVVYFLLIVNQRKKK